VPAGATNGGKLLVVGVAASRGRVVPSVEFDRHPAAVKLREILGRLPRGGSSGGELTRGVVLEVGLCFLGWAGLGEAFVLLDP